MRLTGQLVSLDRTFPLVRIGEQDLRAEYAVSFSRDDRQATVGDWLELEQTTPGDQPQIVEVLPRETLLARRICIEHPSVGSGQFEEHLLAANFDRVFVVVGLGRYEVDLDYLESQLVACFESGGKVGVILNKSDLVGSTEPIGATESTELTEAVAAAVEPTKPIEAAGAGRTEATEATGAESVAVVDDVTDDAPPAVIHSIEETIAAIRTLADEMDVIACSTVTNQGIDDLRALCPPGSMSVFFGRSGVGKSSLINALIGSDVLATQETRARDQAGRHTTVNRQIIFHDGRAYFDTPGVRSIGNYLHEVGLEEVFDDVISLAAKCRFRDCKHVSEPGCAVREAIAEHRLTERRLKSFVALAAEVAGDNVVRQG